MRGRRHQGLRPVRPDDPRLDDPGLRHLRQEHHRKDLRAMIHRECGVLKTSYEADMALYPLPIARCAIGTLPVVFFGIVPLILPHDPPPHPTPPPLARTASLPLITRAHP